MSNEKLLKRMCIMIAMAYAENEEQVYGAFQKLNSIDRTLDLVQTGKLSEIFKQRAE